METERLMEEVKVFTRYLTGLEADEYVCRKYTAHQNEQKPAASRQDEFDEFIVRFATRSTIHAKVADSYSAVFRKHSLLRKKLVLLLAILECSPMHSVQIDRPEPRGKLILMLKLGGQVAAFVFAAIVGAFVFQVARWHRMRGFRVHRNAPNAG